MIMRGMALVATVVMIGAEGPASAQTRAPGSDALRQQIERRFDVLPLHNGLALHPKSPMRADRSVRSIELTDHTIAVDGTPVTGVELRDKLGDDADLVLRLSYLEPEARRALRAASVFGEVFWDGAVAALLGGEREASAVRETLAALADKEIIARSANPRFPRQTEYGFRHGVVRQVSYDTLLDADRVLGPSTIDRWCYATSKAAGEHFCLAYRRLGLPVTILRYFNVYGPRLDRLDVGRVITIFMGQLLRGEPLTVIGDGRQTRCFTYITDAVQATLAAGVLASADGQVINIGTDEETPVGRLAELMIELGGGPSTLRFVPQAAVYGESYEDVPRRVPDVTRMQRLLGLRATTPLAEGLARTIAWFRTADPGAPSRA